MDKLIKTERLILRPWRETDAESLYEYAKDPNVGPIAGWQPHKSVEESLHIIQNVLNGSECYAICEKENGKAIGCIELRLNGHTDMTDKDDECELGYWLGKPFWGRGYMPEAANKILRHAFEYLGMTKVWCGYYEGNTKSKRVQEKLGFVYHHTCNEVPVPLMNEVRVGHTNIMTKENWLKARGILMKTLNTIQTLSKIGKILSKIVYICCIVGFCGCGVGIVAMLIGGEAVKLGGVTLHNILEIEAGVSEGTIWAAIAVGMILCVGEFFVSRMASRYFANELAAGTPFTEENAKELLHLGISVIWIPIVSVVLAQVAQSAIAQFMENVEKFSLDGFDSVALGVMFIFMSLLCCYGAELNESLEKKGADKA